MIKKCFLLWVIISLPSLAKLPFEIEANHIKLKNKNQELYASGNVIINYKTYTIKTNEATYLKKENTLKFNQYVEILDSKNNQLYADNVSLNLESETGQISNGFIQTNKQYFIKAKTILLKKDQIELKECSITTCTSKSPDWYFKSNSLSINKENNLINSNKNIIYFYEIPIFYIPTFTQSVSDDKITNRPTPEFGYNQIDNTYANIYIGYLINKNTSGKTGIGTSEKRGFRYGATHIFTPKKNQSLTLKTYHIKKTGFEGGLSYHWKNNKGDQFQPIISSLFIPSKNRNVDVSLSADYMFDNIHYNELYNAIPEVKLTIENIDFYLNSTLTSGLSTGYFKDRLNQGGRYQLLFNLDNNIIRFNKKTEINNTLSLKNNYYNEDKTHWKRLLNSTAFNFGILNTKNKITYTKILDNNGTSPFVFDTINEINDDEISTESTVKLLPIIIKINSDYQINYKSFRNFTYTAHWVFQCWQIDIGVNTIWEEVTFGISVPNF